MQTKHLISILQILSAAPILIYTLTILLSNYNKVDVIVPLYLSYVAANICLISTLILYVLRTKIMNIDTTYILLTPHIWYILNMFSSFISIQPTLLWCAVSSAPTAVMTVIITLIILPKYLDLNEEL